MITGLSRGKTLRFRVEAHNARGWSHKSGFSQPVTPGAPIAPTGVKAVAGTGQAVVSWTAPTIDNGAPVSGYEVVPYKAGVAGAARVFSSTTPSRLITGLVKGQQYTFRVAAKNLSGSGRVFEPVGADYSFLAPPTRPPGTARLLVVFVVLVVVVFFDEQVVCPSEREHLVGIGADRVIRDAFEQRVPYLFGCGHERPPRQCRRR